MEFERIQRYVGNVPFDQHKFIDSYLGKELAVFIPNGGLVEFVQVKHSHPAYFFYVMSHSRNYVQFEDQTIAVQPDKLLVISPGVEHSEVPLDMQTRYCAISFQKEYFESLMHKHGIPIETYKVAFFERDENLMNYIYEFIDEMKRGEEADSKLLQEIEHVIVNKIVRSLSGVTISVDEYSMNPDIRLSIEYIISNYSSKITLKDLAKLCNISVSRFSSVFKESIGVSPIEYLTEVRLDKAKQSLTLSKDSIASIAQGCGYNSTSNFSKAFKSRFDVTPNEYRMRFEPSR